MIDLYMEREKKQQLKLPLWSYWRVFVIVQITQDMKRSLMDMGFDMKTITNLKPLYAQYVFYPILHYFQIISNAISFDSWKKNNEEFIKACEEEQKQKREEAARLAMQESQNEIPVSEQTVSSDIDTQEGKPSVLAVVPEEEKPKTTPSLMIVEEKKEDSFQSIVFLALIRFLVSIYSLHRTQNEKRDNC